MLRCVYSVLCCVGLMNDVLKLLWIIVWILVFVSCSFLVVVK